MKQLWIAQATNYKIETERLETLRSLQYVFALRRDGERLRQLY